MPKLSTTSFALLGLLGRQAWSAYELTRFMRHSILRAIWPRAESHIYSECKNLEQHGLVDATGKTTGKRKRTEYAINADGQQALREWLAQPVASRFLIESELLTKLVNASEEEELLALLHSFREEAVQDAAWTRLETAKILDGSMPVPAGREQNAMVTALLVDMMECRLRWAQQMEAIVQDRSTPVINREARALQLYAEIDGRLAGINESGSGNS